MFLNKQYSSAYPLLLQLKNANEQYGLIEKQDLDFYFTVTELQLQNPAGVTDGIAYLQNVNNFQTATAVSYFLGHYFFTIHDFENAIVYFEKAGYNYLGNAEIIEMKFELAYAYFFQKNYAKAKPLFNEIHQLPGDKYYLPANYYFGFIAYRDKELEDALKSFQLVEKLPEYNGIVPYYIAEIYYAQHKNNEALNTALQSLGNPDFYYKKELQLLAGQIYFEKKEFKKALPLLSSYISESDKVSKQVLYEQAFSYYSVNEVDKAIEGFKQLSSGNDSLSQNSMYLLGDLYLKAGDKASARNAFLFSSENSSNRLQQEVSKFNYAKLSYELHYADVALKEIKVFISNYPTSKYKNEADELFIHLLVNSNNYTEGLKVYNSITNPSLEMQKVYPHLLVGRGVELFNEQKIEDAKELLLKALGLSKDVQLLSYTNFWLAEINFREGKYDDAIGYVKKYLPAGKTNGEANIQNANYLLGYSLLKKQDYTQALKAFQNALNGSDLSTQISQDITLRLADSYFMLKDYEKARSLYQSAISKNYASADYALYQLGVISGISSSSEKILKLRELGTRFPSSELINDANLEIANTLMFQEKFNEGIPFLQKLANGNSNEYKPKAYLKLALSFYNLNNNKSAIEYYNKLLIEYPQAAESDLALENMKNLYVESGQTEQYFNLLKKTGRSISITEQDSLSFQSAQLKYDAGECNVAVAALDNYLQNFPKGAFFLRATYLKSDCLLKAKNYKEAIIGYELLANTSGNKYTEPSLLITARLYYLELNDYNKAKLYFSKLNQLASSPENQLEALRGLVRTYYQTKDFAEANNVARQLLTKKNISTDDRAIAGLVLGKSLEAAKQFEEAIVAFNAVLQNKSVWSAEANYEIAHTYLDLNNLTSAEKNAMAVIKSNTSDLWVAKSYILLGDVYFIQKDYFNAKATFQSVATHSTIPDLIAEAQLKLDKVLAEEKLNTKVIQ
ncbi:MAG: tetratricopeptide repeat protein [Ginsengibacter sp.]